MNRTFSKFSKIHFLFLLALSGIARFTAHIGAESASAWGYYQPQFPDELKR